MNKRIIELAKEHCFFIWLAAAIVLGCLVGEVWSIKYPAPRIEPREWDTLTNHGQLTATMHIQARSTMTVSSNIQNIVWHASNGNSVIVFFDGEHGWLRVITNSLIR